MRASRSTSLALAALVALPAVAVAQTEHRTISGNRVSIYNLAGRLDVRAASSGNVTVDVTRAGRDGARLELATGEIRGSQALRVIYPSDRIVYQDLGRRGRIQLNVNPDGTFDDDQRDGSWRRRDGRVEITDSGSGLEAHADMVVGVPKGQRIAIHWGAGNAQITNVDGDLRVSVAASRVTSQHTRGRLSLDTGSGEVSVTDAQGDLKLDTGSGGVTVNGVHGENLDIDTGSGSVSGADVDARSLTLDVGSGGIKLDRVNASRVSVDAGSGGTELGFVATVDDLAVDAGSGGVTIRLPSTQGGDVDIDTGSGGIESDFAVQTTHIERNHLRGRIGGGNARIKIESGSGHVRLLKN